MSTTTNVNQIKLNIMTQEQYDATEKSASELYMITDADSGQKIQVTTLPTASANELDKIYQYIGATGTYTNGYFYKCVSDGEVSPTYSWEAIQVQAISELSSQAGNTGNFLTTDGTTPSADGDYVQTLSISSGTATHSWTSIASSVDSSSTNAETIGAKLFYDTCGNIETLINAL